MHITLYPILGLTSIQPRNLLEDDSSNGVGPKETVADYRPEICT